MASVTVKVIYNVEDIATGNKDEIVLRHRVTNKVERTAFQSVLSFDLLTLKRVVKVCLYMYDDQDERKTPHTKRFDTHTHTHT